MIRVMRRIVDQLGIEQECAQEREATQAAMDEQRVLADPAEPRQTRVVALEKRSRVGDRSALYRGVIPAQPLEQFVELAPDNAMVVDPARIACDLASERVERLVFVILLTINQAHHHDRANPVEHVAGVRPGDRVTGQVIHAGGVTAPEPLEKVGIVGRRDRRSDANGIEAQLDGPRLESIRDFLGCHRPHEKGPSVTCQTKAFINVARRIRAVERVEMDSANLIVEKVAALFGRPVNADLRHGRGVILTTADRAE